MKIIELGKKKIILHTAIPAIMFNCTKFA